MADMTEKAIDEMLAMVSDLINESKGVPFRKDMCLIDRDGIIDIIDDIRARLPGELEHAKSIVSTRDQILATAKEDADKMLALAKTRAKSLVAEEDIVAQARREAEGIRKTTELKVQEMKLSAATYVEETLKKVETTIGDSVEDIRKLRMQIKTSAAATKK